MVNSIDNLQKLISTDKYLLHGSPFKLNVLKPQIPQNTSPNAYTKKGVYTTDVLEIAIFTAILDHKKLPKINNIQKLIYSYYKDDNKWHFGVTRNVLEHNAFNNGFVYILDKPKFNKLHIPGEYIAEKPVQPVDIITINPDEFTSSNQISPLPLSYLNKSGTLSPKQLQAMGY